MSTPGRNETCHCGSGKKYKKCCLEKDAAKLITAPQKNQAIEQWEPEEDDRKTLLLEEETDYDEDDDDEYDGNNIEDGEEDDEEVDEYKENDLHEIAKNEDSRKSILNKPYPVISAAEQQLVEDWWETLEDIKGPEDTRKHIEHFMQMHPHLVENLGLEDEVLFELGSDYKKVGKAEDYIQFLLKIRNEFPGTYGRSGGYYDLDIIAWLIANNRQDEIENYLSYFKEYPIDFPEQLFELVQLLEATDNVAPLISLVTATFKQVTCSNEILSGNEILIPLVSQTMSKYLQKGIADINVDEFMDELSQVVSPVTLDKTDDTLNHWKNIFENIVRPFTNWPTDIPKKKSQIEKRYQAIADNFSRYLHEKTGISWVSARFYASLILRYFHKYLDSANGKIKNQFDFAKPTINQIAGSVSKKLLWIDCTKMVSLLQAIYHFAGYLQECGNITEAEKLTIQQDCRTLYHVAHPSLIKNYTEAACYKTFPYIKAVILQGYNDD